MKTQTEFQLAVDEIRAVCKRHGVILVGTCESEGIYGEIMIADNTLSDVSIGWKNVKEQLTNKAKPSYHSGDVVTVDGIGDT